MIPVVCIPPLANKYYTIRRKSYQTEATFSEFSTEENRSILKRVNAAVFQESRGQENGVHSLFAPLLYWLDKES